MLCSISAESENVVSPHQGHLWKDDFEDTLEEADPADTNPVT